MTWRIEEETSEGEEEDDDERWRCNDDEAEEQEDEGEEGRGFEDYGWFSKLKQIRVEASRDSGIGFDFRHLRPFVLAFGFVRTCSVISLTTSVMSNCPVRSDHVGPQRMNFISNPF